MRAALSSYGESHNEKRRLEGSFVMLEDRGVGVRQPKPGAGAKKKGLMAGW
jgi:hypothetical protein